LAVASVAHPEENPLSSSNAITQANLRYTKSEQNPSVSYGCEYVLVVTDDQQAQQSSSGIFANAQNTIINGGSFIVGSLHVCDFITNSSIELCQYPPC
jgi:hypothetical protein